ncbi:Uncharacterised protein [Klebsiella pneumoniae]|nr:Uncharacterised protein [Klebsiella pneumoniae]SYT06448.1 Uncharacterised protein [Klebsiella pneumoniae]VUG74106.1 Uncharacterised protein [Klebsiella pneumoniae]
MFSRLPSIGATSNCIINNIDRKLIRYTFIKVVKSFFAQIKKNSNQMLCVCGDNVRNFFFENKFFIIVVSP